ncbi:MAG: FxsA family protein [Thermoleophilia bacterium]
MFMILLATFIIVPLAELAVIIEIGSRIGYLYTILILILISFGGAALAKRQGYNAMARIQEDFRQGRMPGDSLIDGALILSAALLLLTPGYITDTVGLLLLLPPVRLPVRKFVRRRLQLAIERRTVRFGPGGGGRGYGPGGPSGPAGSTGGPAGGPAGPEPEQRRKELEG